MQSPTKGFLKDSGRAAQRSLIQVFLVLLPCWAPPAWSATVTLNEAGIETIYSQNGFPGPIDLRYAATLQLVAPDLLEINSSAEFYMLNTLANQTFTLATTTVPFFYVDSIQWCATNRTVAGCANTTFAVLDADNVAGGAGDELMAHELGHVFGLDHPVDTADLTDDGADNLMQSTVRNNITNVLVATQITDIFMSPKVLGDAVSGYYVDIAPILIVAAANVPLPAPFLLFVAALVPIAVVGRRRVA